MTTNRNRQFCASACYYEGSKRATCATTCHVTAMLKGHGVRAATLPAATLPAAYLRLPTQLSMRDAKCAIDASYAALNRGVIPR